MISKPKRSIFSIFGDENAYRTSVQLKQVLVIGAVVGIAALFSFLLGKSKTLYAILLAVGVIGLFGAYILQKQIAYAPLLILGSGLFIPYTLPTGTSSRIAIAMVLTGFYLVVWILRQFLAEKRFKIISFPGSGFLLGFMIIAVISLVWSTIFRDPVVKVWGSFTLVQLSQTVVMILLPVALWLTAEHLKEEKIIQWMVYGFVVAAGLNFIRRMANINIPVNGEGLFSMWAMAICGALLLFNRKYKLWEVIALAGVLAGTVIWSFFRNIDWLAGWLPGLFTLGILIFMRSKKMTLAIALILVAYVIIRWSYFRSVFFEEQTISGVTRLAAWQQNLAITKNHLLFGMGPAGYAAYYMTYIPNNAMATHSNYLDILSETGITGFVCYVGFFLLFALYGYRVCLRLKDRHDFLSAMAHAAFAGTAGCILIMAFGDWLIPFAYTQSIAGYSYAVYSWIFMGLLPVIDRLAQAHPLPAIQNA